MAAELNARKLQTTPDFPTRYGELASIGIRDVDMLRQLKTTPRKLRDLMQKYGHRPSPLLNEMATEEEKRR